jgi:DNA segregation ATPase FtsK/SpoIIIE, S-DNA-T family
MSASPLDVVGLFDPQRQRRLLAGVVNRVHRTRDELARLQARLVEEESLEVERLDLRRHETVDHCREQRREMLERWDEAEERLTVEYESATVKITQDLTRLAALYRRKLADEKKTIERKVEARRGAVLQQYENRRHAPGQQMRKEIAQIDHALLPVQENVEVARALTIRRLDRLPEVPPPASEDEKVAEALPQSVNDTADMLHRYQRRLNETIHEMQTGAASKIVDSFYLPAGVAVFIVMWVAAVFIIQPNQLLLWMGASVPVAGALGFSIYGVLLMPLRSMTRRLYPRSERLLLAAEAAAEAGRKIANKTAHESSTELIERRDAHIQAAERWHTEQNLEAEKRLAAEQATAKQQLESLLQEKAKIFTREFNKVGAQMRGDANSLAQSISHTLSQTEQENQNTRHQLELRRKVELKRAEHRLREGIIRGLQRMDLACERVEERFANWPQIASSPLSEEQCIPCLPVGHLLITDHLRQSLTHTHSIHQSDDGSHASLFGAALPEAVPVVLHRRLQTGLIINAASTQVDQAIDLAQAILWRLLCGVAPGRAKITLIDPVGRGQNFASFMSMTDHQADIVGHRVWSGERQIEERLAEIAHHAEDILQVNLRDRFSRIEEYNQIAGSMFEPYRAIAAIGFPESLTRDGYKHLRAILDSSSRCGVFTILVCDQSHPWPSDMQLPHDRRLLRLSIDHEGRWHHDEESLRDLTFRPIQSPPAVHRGSLIQRIGVAAVNASKVEIPFDSIASSTTISNKPIPQTPALPELDRTDDQVVIPLGVQGARRLQSLRLGEGVKQHVLIAGKTGSGKSSLLHTIITAGAAKYRPDQLHYYLLDFKKGVEFKIYADAGLPHARVIGIESEREFGRSVLQRLDADLQARGELFREAGVQELSEYRRVTGKEMPRVMLVVDEFQELFSRDDRLAADCTGLLDRLVRQGRSFGMHVILSSQSLAGSQSLPRATLGQMAVRIALQCSESDAVLILSDDNTAARLISRPGEAIYNDAGGLLEGNQPFQVAYLTTDRQRVWLQSIAERDQADFAGLPPRVVFEGNRPCRWNAALANASNLLRKPGTLSALLGESVEIGPPTTLTLTREPGRNVLIVAPNEMTGGLLASCMSGFAESRTSLSTPASIIYFEGGRSDELALGQWIHACGLTGEIVKPRDSEAKLAAIADLVKQRVDNDQSEQPGIVLVIDPLERFRDLRQDESFSFSLDAAAVANGSESLQKVLRDGPAVGVFTILVCGTAETLARWLPRAARHDLQQRILGRINPSDSSALIDRPDAANLSAATMLIYDDSDGSLRKFRVCDLPDPKLIRDWVHGDVPDAISSDYSSPEADSAMSHNGVPAPTDTTAH